MDIPGTPARHAIITENCMKTHGDLGAFDEGVRRLREEYQSILNGWGERAKELTFHIVLTVERPK